MEKRTKKNRTIEKIRKNKVATYKIKKKKLRRKVDDIKLIRNPPKLLKDLAANILRLETLIKERKISEIEKINRYY